MNRKNVFKNGACLMTGLTLVLVSAIFMGSIYYEHQIQAQIQTVAILKDIKFHEWGQLPNTINSIYTQNFTLYSHQLSENQLRSTKSNITKNFNYTYKYSNVSFAQGNSGKMNYIEHWKLVDESSNKSNNIETVNYGADYIYNYDFYAPPQRKFTILYSYLNEFLANDFLEMFYSEYLYKYFFNDEDMVINTVFLPLEFDLNDAKQIYHHQILGWDSVQKFKNWVIMSLKGIDDKKNSPFFQQCMTELELSNTQMQKLIYERSTLYNMISALNGTIKAKLMDRTQYGYKCQDRFCSSEEIAAIQFSTNFLGKDPVFASLSLNKNIKQLNQSIPTDIEYQIFKKSNPSLEDIPLKSIVDLFSSKTFADFQKMDIFWKNQNKYDYIESVFNIGSGTGQTLVKYINYLYKNLIQKYQDNFAWATTTYNNLDRSLKIYHDFLLTELYSRAYENKYLIDQSQCQKYFVNDFKNLQKLCNSSKWNIVKNTRSFVKAYLFIDNMRGQFADETDLQITELIDFFNNPEKSLFASNIAAINTVFKQSFGCSGDICATQELFYLQWGSNHIISNLPNDYFPQTNSILKWDTQNILHGYIPDIYSELGIKLTVSQCKQILSSTNGIMSLFNLNKMISDKNQTNKLSYIAKIVMNVGLNGFITKYNADELLNGFKSQIIQNKRKMDISQGGAPWLNNQFALVKLNNQLDIDNNEKMQYPQYSQLNTGIYNRDNLREILSIWGQKYSSSSYKLFSGEKYDDEGNLVEFSLFEKYTTDHKIQGTNMLGFHPNIDKQQNLTGYFQQAYTPISWQCVDQIQYASNQESKPKKYITAYKYKLAETDKLIKINIEELNHNSIQLVDSSYLIVQPISGVTLGFMLEYKVVSQPSFLKFYLNTNKPDNIVLYDSMLAYQRTQTAELQNISDNIKSKDSLQTWGIVVGCVCGIVAIVMIIMYCKTPQISKKQTLLTTSQSTI